MPIDYHPQRVPSFLTQLGFRQIESIYNAVEHNLETAGEFIVTKDTNAIYRFDPNSNLVIDNNTVLATADGGTTRWISCGKGGGHGDGGTVTRVEYTMPTAGVDIPLGRPVVNKDSIFNVNVGNVQLLAKNYTLNETRDVIHIITDTPFEKGTDCEVVFEVSVSSVIDFSDAGRDMLSSLALPSTNVINLVLKPSGPTEEYLIPAPGWVLLKKLSTAAGQSIKAKIERNGQVAAETSSGYSTAAGQALMILIPAQRVDTLLLEYDVDGETQRFDFIYALGARIGETA